MRHEKVSSHPLARKLRVGVALQAVIAGALLPATMSAAEPAFTLGTMPRVDVHTHFGNVKEIDSFIRVQDVLRQQHRTHLAIAINLQPFQPVGNPPPLTTEFFDLVESRYQGRVLSAIGEYNVPRGLQYSPDELAAWLKRGIVGYKIWYPVVIGPTAPAKDLFTIYAPDYPGIDNPANEPVFAAMERLGLVGAGVHIAQAHPRRWKDPVHFWTAIQAWLRVLNRHPRMVVVMAHMMNLFTSDQQLDFLAWVLETHRNVHLEFGGRFGEFGSMNREHLRAFVIRYSDRIMFGTDFTGPGLQRHGEQTIAQGYVRAFKLLETDEPVTGGMLSDRGPTNRGLALPVEVLAKIYYQNASRIFPRVEATLQRLGYPVGQEPKNIPAAAR